MVKLGTYNPTIFEVVNMKIKFDWSDQTFEVESDAPTVTSTNIKIPRPPRLGKVDGKRFPRFIPQPPEIIHGRLLYEPIMLKFNDVQDKPELTGMVQRQWDAQMSMDLTSKFNAVLSDDGNDWNLIGCFFESWEMCDTSHYDTSIKLSVMVSMDHIPGLHPEPKDQPT